MPPPNLASRVEKIRIGFKLDAQTDPPLSQAPHQIAIDTACRWESPRDTAQYSTVQ
jgi:hypothetical protein